MKYLLYCLFRIVWCVILYWSSELAFIQQKMNKFRALCQLKEGKGGGCFACYRYYVTYKGLAFSQIGLMNLLPNQSEILTQSIAKDAKVCNYCCYIRCLTIKYELWECLGNKQVQFKQTNRYTLSKCRSAHFFYRCLD